MSRRAGGVLSFCTSDPCEPTPLSSDSVFLINTSQYCMQLPGIIDQDLGSSSKSGRL